METTYAAVRVCTLYVRQAGAVAEGEASRGKLITMIVGGAIVVHPRRIYPECTRKKGQSLGSKVLTSLRVMPIHVAERDEYELRRYRKMVSG